MTASGAVSDHDLVQLSNSCSLIIHHKLAFAQNRFGKSLILNHLAVFRQKHGFGGLKLSTLQLVRTAHTFD